MKHKLETFVNFPIHDLDLTNYVAHKNSSRNQIYVLYALTNHYGGMGSGHYTAHIKVSEIENVHGSPFSFSWFFLLSCYMEKETQCFVS